MKWFVFLSLWFISGISCVSVSVQSTSPPSPFILERENRILLWAQTEDSSLNRLLEEALQRELRTHGFTQLFLASSLERGAPEDQTDLQGFPQNAIDLLISLSKGKKQSPLPSASSLKPIVSYDVSKDCESYLITMTAYPYKQQQTVEMVADFSWCLFKRQQDLVDKISQEFLLWLDGSRQQESLIYSIKE